MITRILTVLTFFTSLSILMQFIEATKLSRAPNIDRIAYSLWLDNISKPLTTLKTGLLQVPSFAQTKQAKRKTVSVVDYGANPNDSFDDKVAIMKAINSGASVIVFPPALTKAGAYCHNGRIDFSGLVGKRLLVKGSRILNTSTSSGSWYFENCRNISIYSGEWGYLKQPTSNLTATEHVFQFERCQDILVSGIHITGSPEMGIAITSSNRATVQNSIIEHTFRDGIYSHYSANVKYLRNTIRHNKDDAISFHDYGMDAQRTFIMALGYPQATNFLAEGNKVENAVSGLSSIGGKGVRIINNTFTNTVLAGVTVWNSKDLFPGGNAIVRGAEIAGNRFYSNCKSQVINGVSVINNNQNSHGRASIYVGSSGTGDQINAGETSRLSKVNVHDNIIYNSAALGFCGRMIDGLTFKSNKFVNCTGTNKVISGDVVELGLITLADIDQNTILDTRKKVQHSHAYSLNNVSGREGVWHVNATVNGSAIRGSTQPLQVKTPSESTLKR